MTDKRALLARELLAAELKAEGCPETADDILRDTPLSGVGPLWVDCTLRAIEKALSLSPTTAREEDGSIWLWFADNSNIRKWSDKPFPEGIEYVPAAWQFAPDSPPSEGEQP